MEEVKKYQKQFKEEKLTEGSNYPSQYDAEIMLELTNALNISTGMGSPEIRKLVNDIDNMRLKVWQNIFGDKSPWSVEVNKKGKGKVYWNKEKAEKLGL